MSNDTQKIVVVTGGAGFVGSHLCARLAHDGHHVISLDNYFTGSKENHVPGVEYRTGHTKDIATLIPEIPDLIYHLGEYARVEQSVLEPEIVHDLNTVGTAAVVAYWRTKRCKLVYAGSSTKFGDGGKTRGTSPYAATKAANTELVRDTGIAEKLPYAITYFYNVYGPGERGGIYGTTIEWFKEMYLRGEPITVVAPGTQTRNYTYIDDIVAGLVVVGERGEGDEYGIGHECAHQMIDVARFFGTGIVMLPARSSNRMSSQLHTDKTRALGWRAQHDLESHIHAFVAAHPRGGLHERRVLVMSTTFFPVEGPAERALRILAENMPDVQFDIVTSIFSKEKTDGLPKNVSVYRVGRGRRSDKYLLPILGMRMAYALHRKHQYLFTWSLMASYAALAGVFLKKRAGLPLLVTFADQDLENHGWMRRFILSFIIAEADQAYGVAIQEKAAHALRRSKPFRRSLGVGDAFANQLRYAYADIIHRAL